MKKLPIAIGLSVVFAVAGCGSSSSGGSPSTPKSPPPPLANSAAGKAAASAQIKANWAVFFKTGTPTSTAIPLLENGANLGPAIKFAAKIAKAEKTTESAKVTKIAFVDPSHANITYDLDGNGKPLLPGADGKAVLVGSTWQISQQTFCTLVDLGAAGKKVPGC
jgi:hypothetical protein